jgi:DNA-binding NtrC family response regulator
MEERRFRGRIVAATHVDLLERVMQGRFREDLFHRLDVLEVHVPALEERPEDIPVLVDAFLARQPRRMRFTEDALAALRSRRWPGNVRELRNLVDRAAVLCHAELVSAADLERLERTQGDRRSSLDRVAAQALAVAEGNKLEALERAMVAVALKTAGGNKSAAARLLGVHRKVIERHVEKYPA